MKLEEGIYVRTRNGLIFKIIGGNVDNWDLDISFDILESFEENWLELYKYNDNGSFFNNKNIVKASHNIIDLIEVGDIIDCEYGGVVSKCEVINEDDKLGIGWDNDGDFINLESVDIKSIVTSQQFESMSYKVGEE